MCVVLADGDGKSGENLCVLQVIEALAYDSRGKAASIIVDLMIDSQREGATSVLVLHPGLVKAAEDDSNLLAGIEDPRPVSGSIPAATVLRRIYRSRISTDGDVKTFHQRKNCFLLADNGPTKVPHCDPPELGFDVEMPTEEERTSLGEQVPSFTGLRLSGITKGISWRRIRLRLEGASYAQFVGDQVRFWVTGPARVFEKIVEDIPRYTTILPRARDYFQQSFSKAQLLPPSALDVVIFRSGVSEANLEVVCEPVSGDVYEATNHSELQFAHLFVTRSPMFWIDLHFQGSLVEHPMPTGTEDSAVSVP